MNIPLRHLTTNYPTKMLSASSADDCSSSRPTPEMLADAARRNSAPRTLVSWLMGDPPPGQSALDKRSAPARDRGISLWHPRLDVVR